MLTKIHKRINQTTIVVYFDVCTSKNGGVETIERHESITSARRGRTEKNKKGYGPCFIEEVQEFRTRLL